MTENDILNRISDIEASLGDCEACPCGRARVGCDYHDPALQPEAEALAPAAWPVSLSEMRANHPYWTCPSCEIPWLKDHPQCAVCGAVVSVDELRISDVIALLGRASQAAPWVIPSDIPDGTVQIDAFSGDGRHWRWTQ